MSPLSAVGDWNDQHGTDDAPLWAEAVGILFAPVLFVRAGTHVWAALLTGGDPHLTDDHDIRLASPVRGCRESPRARAVGALLALAFALGAWALLAPLSAAWVGSVAVQAFVVANTLVLACDPLASVLTILNTWQN